MSRVRLRRLTINPEEVKEGKTKVTLSFRAMHEDESSTVDLNFKLDPDNKNLYLLNDKKEHVFPIDAPKDEFEDFSESVTIEVKNPPINSGAVGVQLVWESDEHRDSVLDSSIYIIK